MMTCIAQKLDMPTSVETKLKAVITQSVSALQSSSSDLQLFSNLQSLNTSWNLKDGSTIYLSFGPPTISIGDWSASFSVTKSASDTTSSSNSSSNLNSGEESGNQSISSDNVSNSSNSSSSDNSSFNSSTNSGGNAYTDMNNATTCTAYETSYNDMSFNQGPNGNTQNIIVDGVKAWGSTMACLAQELQMPTNIKNKLKEYIDKGTSAPSDQSFDKEERTYITSWPLAYGTILLTYKGPVDYTTGGWTAEFQPSI